MDNKDIVVDINSITNTKQMMDSECDGLISMIKKYKTMFEETKVFYDTEAAILYRRIAISYLDVVENYINNNFKPYINSLDDIKKTYINEINDISSSVQGGSV